MSAYAWEALLLAGSIALADPVKAYTCEVDVESRVASSSLMIPIVPSGKSSLRYRLTRHADLTRIRPGLTLVFAEEDLQVVTRGAGRKGVQ